MRCSNPDDNLIMSLRASPIDSPQTASLMHDDPMHPICCKYRSTLYRLAMCM